jgi:GNAT superfamily N-acetyltransferase
VEIRPLETEDIDLIRAMLVEAAFWDPGQSRPAPDEALATPTLSRYHRDWGRPGDFGFAAEVDGRALGAAWARLLRGRDAGYGHVADTVPELSMAVVPGHRSRGAGTALLGALVTKARRLGVPGLSLSVATENRPAVALYRAAGFAPATEPNGGSVTMLLDLPGA